MRLMTEQGGKSGDEDGEKPLAIAMHWGTFVTDPVDILKTLGQLEWACINHDVQFIRSLDEDAAGDGKAKEGRFLALNHGQSVAL